MTSNVEYALALAVNSMGRCDLRLSNVYHQTLLKESDLMPRRFVIVTCVVFDGHLKASRNLLDLHHLATHSPLRLATAIGPQIPSAIMSLTGPAGQINPDEAPNSEEIEKQFAVKGPSPFPAGRPSVPL